MKPTELEERYGARNYAPLDIVIDRAEGVWVWDVDGRRYLDCLAAYSAVNQGHCHPRIVDALIRQSRKVAVTSRAFHNAELGAFFRDVCELTGFERALPMNTGAEAVETAIKLARKWAYTRKGVTPGRAEILAFANNFHGRTTTIVGFSSEPQYRDGFGPFTPGFELLPFGDASAARAAVGPDTAAVLVEPIQGEGGIVVPPDGYLAELREVCSERNTLLIVDEIQSGLGRTGRMFAHEHDGIRPDVMLLGKALSGGLYPVSVVVADAEIMDVFQPGDHGSTYGGNPVGAAVARAALAVLQEERLVENSARLGEHALRRLRDVEASCVREVRGRGLWIGIELVESAGGARPYCEKLAAQGLLCKETHDHVIRFAPPLVIRQEELDWALDRIEEVLTA